MTKLGAAPAPSSQPRGFSRRHPHTIGSWNANNTIYTGPGNTAVSDTPGLRLSLPVGPASHWSVPPWLRHAGLTYHSDPSRWGSDGTLRAVARGQEFVANIAGVAEAARWLRGILAMISGGTPGAVGHA